MTPYYEQEGITIYHGDCREHLGLEAQALVTDPPYGIDWRPRVNHQDGPWHDTERIELMPWLRFQLLCIWGGNYFTDQLPVSEGWLIWLKRPPGFDDDPRTYAPLEMAWTNAASKPQVKTWVWDGGKRQGARVNREFNHPAQKPLEVMRWSIERLGVTGHIVDPFMGSGTTLEAAKSVGLKATGIEREERYCEIAAKRLSQGVLSGMF